MRTVAWTRAHDDSLQRDNCKAFEGIPVMLKVPSHIEVKIMESLYAVHDPDSHELKTIPLVRPDLDVTAELKYTEKMFLVDPQRVASGTGEYGFGFAGDGGVKIPNSNGDAKTGHGYLHSANYKANDETIKNASQLLSTVLSINKKSATEVPNALVVTRLVAFERFDLGSKSVNAEVMAFLDEHLNNCHHCSTDGKALPIEYPKRASVNGVPASKSPSK